MNARAEDGGAAVPLAPRRVVVRLYDEEGGRAADARRGFGITERIFRAIGIEIAWRLCPPPDRRVAPRGGWCERTPLGFDLMLYVKRAPLRARTNDSLGAAYVDQLTGTGALAVVYRDLIAERADAFGLNAGLLFGRVIAHELGHLLGIRHDSGGGLMRAFWSARMLQLDRDADFQFAAGQAERLRDDHAARSIAGQD